LHRQFHRIQQREYRPDPAGARRSALPALLPQGQRVDLRPV